MRSSGINLEIMSQEIVNWEELSSKHVSQGCFGNHTSKIAVLCPRDQWVNITLQGHIMMTSSNGNFFRVTGLFATGPGEFPTQRPVTRSFDVFFDLRLNKRLSKQPWGWWFETLPWSLWRHCNVTVQIRTHHLTYNWIVTCLTCGLVMPYGDKDLGQHWLR